VRPEHPDHPGLNTATGVGVYGANISNNGGVGVEGDAGNNAFGVAAIAAGTGIGLFASANTSYGIWAYGQYPLYVQGTTQVGNPIAAFIAPGGGVEVNDIGNLYVTGFVYTDGSCQMGCSRTRHVASFAARTSSPTIDDVGEGALRAGSAHVMIERAFANAIDPNKTYVVLLTPEGDSHNLYVTNRTPHSFDVRESHGGRSSVGFAYRIVAKPYGARDERLPFHTMEAPAARRGP